MQQAAGPALCLAACTDVEHEGGTFSFSASTLFFNHRKHFERQDKTGIF